MAPEQPDKLVFPADIHHVAADIRRQALQNPDKDPVVRGARRRPVKRKATKTTAKRKKADRTKATKAPARKTSPRTTRARRK